MIRSNEHFRAGIVNLFFEGASVRFLADKLPLFELKKLGITKLQFDVPSLIDTLVRYKEKGSYSGKAERNPEIAVADIIKGIGLMFERGDLNELVANALNEKRTMDFIIPSKATPRVIAESSFLVTTSSGQGDKSKTEISIRQLIKQHYPRAKFIIRTNEIAKTTIYKKTMAAKKICSILLVHWSRMFGRTFTALNTTNIAMSIPVNCLFISWNALC